MILTNVTAPNEGVRLIQSSVQAYLDQQSLGNGTLYVSESTLTWVDTSDSRGFSLTYPSIVLHAISTDLSVFAQEHIYVLVDGERSERRQRRAPAFLITEEEAQHHEDLQIGDSELNNEGDSEDDDSESEKNIEIRFVPDDKNSLSQIYHEIAVCQELNPEEDESFSEDENMEDNGNENQQLWYTAENMESFELNEEGRANLQRLFGERQQNGSGDHQDEEME